MHMGVLDKTMLLQCSLSNLFEQTKGFSLGFDATKAKSFTDTLSHQFKDVRLKLKFVPWKLSYIGIRYMC